VFVAALFNEPEQTDVDWLAQNAYVVQYTLYRVRPFLMSLKEYPPSQRVGSFSIDQMMEALERSVSATTGGK